ncbi:MAG: TRAP transporter TatT component family protein [Candidatus Bipolaricaulia bacterium]
MPLLLVVACTPVVCPILGAEAEVKTPINDLIEKGDKAARKARYKNRTEKQLRKSLSIYKKVLKIDSANNRALNRLSLGYFTLAEAYLNSGKKKIAAYRSGYDYGLRSLRTNEQFSRLCKEKGSKEALKHLPESVRDVPALFGTAANLGRLLEDKGLIASLKSIPILIELNRRVLTLDEDYLGGGAHRALGALQCRIMENLPITFILVQNYGFSWQEAKRHFQKAIKLAPSCLDNYFFYAKYYLAEKGKKDRALNLLEEVLKKPIGKKYPLVNLIAKQKAKTFMQNFKNS